MLFVACYLLVVENCWLFFAVCCVLFVVCGLLFVIFVCCRPLLGALSFVVWCLLLCFGVRYALLFAVGCCLSVVGRCVLFVVRCLLIVVC